MTVEKGRGALWVGLVLAALSVLSLLYLATVGLRWAHTYRQWSYEGLGFVHVGLGLVLASAGAVTAIVLLRVGRSHMGTARRRMLDLTSVGLGLLMVGSLVFAVYVESLGERCFGPCG